MFKSSYERTDKLIRKGKQKTETVVSYQFRFCNSNELVIGCCLILFNVRRELPVADYADRGDFVDSRNDLPDCGNDGQSDAGLL
jgi:hypothetical protein